MLCHLGVSCHENQILDSRLRDLDAVERVRVVHRQRGDFAGVGAIDRQFRIAVVDA